MDEYLLLFHVAFYIGVYTDIKSDHKYVLLDSYITSRCGWELIMTIVVALITQNLVGEGIIFKTVHFLYIYFFFWPYILRPLKIKTTALLKTWFKRPKLSCCLHFLHLVSFIVKTNCPKWSYCVKFKKWVRQLFYVCGPWWINIEIMQLLYERLQ